MELMECKSCGAMSDEFEAEEGDFYQWSDAEEWICPNCVEEFELEAGQND